LVQISSGLSWTRQRFLGRKVRGGSVVGASVSPQQDPESWSVFPYSVGLLQSYAARHAAHPEAYRFLPPIFKRLPVATAVEQLRGAAVVGFSVYVWNIRLSLAIARRLKALRPETLVVFGGPQVPDRAERFLREHPFVDVACHGEGEAVFLSLLERSASRDFRDVPGISHLDAASGFVSHPKAPRLADLERIPSPYLSGVFAPLLEANPQERFVMLWETNRGCPFSCTFCDWGSAVASKVFKFGVERLRQELEWFAGRRGEFVFCCDANFGILPRDLELAEHAAAVKRRTGFPRTLSVQNTKNATERAYRVQSLLAGAGMNAGVTLSLQSTSEQALLASRRDNISSASFSELQRRYTRDGIETYTDMILSLPGESYASFTKGVGEVIAGGQHGRIQFYNCAMLPNAEISDPEYAARHGLVSVPQRLVAMHSPIDVQDEAEEELEIVVATQAMPAEDWVRAKAFWWMTDLLHFDRLLQIPFVTLHEGAGLAYDTLIGAFCRDDERFPVVAGVHRFFNEKARDIQRGGTEYCPSPRWLSLHWPADQLALIELCSAWKLDDFYAEAERILIGELTVAGAALSQAVVRDACRLNQALLRTPFEIDDLDLTLDHDVLGCYRGALAGQHAPLSARASHYRIDRTGTKWLSWEEWCEHLVFCQNQKATYLYPSRELSAPVEVLRAS
jgi:hypothetical protein